MRDGIPSALAGAAAGFLLATALRALLSTAFYLSLATLRLNWTALWLLVLLAPALAPLVPRTRVPAVAAGFAVALLPLARFTPAYVPVAAAASAAGLLALAHLGRRGLFGALVGLALNGALLVLGVSHDPLVSLAGVAVGLALAAGLALVPPAGEDAPPTVAGGIAWAALLLAVVSFLASPYAVGRHLGVPAWAALVAVLAGLALGPILRRAPPWALALAAVAALADVALLRSPLALLLLVLLAAVVAAVALRLPRPHGVALAAVFAPATFAFVYFGQAMGRWEWALTIPLLVLVALAAATWRAPAPVRPPRRVLALLALGLLAVPTAIPAPDVAPHAGDQIVVVNWNVHQGFGNRRALDPQVYADVLRDLDPDVVILQEADTARLSSGGLDIVEYLARALGLHAHARGTSIVVLSRFPMAEGTAAESSGWTTRVALDVHGETVHVRGVHLARSREARVDQVRAILESANATAGPLVLAGDLNSCAADVCFGGRPSDGVHDALRLAYRDAWLETGGGEGPEGFTHPAWDPRRRIDVVMVRGFDVIEAYPVRDARTVAGSDHLPVVARVTLDAG